MANLSRWVRVEVEVYLDMEQVGTKVQVGPDVSFAEAYGAVVDAQKAVAMEVYGASKCPVGRKHEWVYRTGAVLAGRVEGIWLPISLAPKDGSIVDLWDGKRRQVGCSWADNRWRTYNGTRGGVLFYSSGIVPTHFMWPLQGPKE